MKEYIKICIKIRVSERIGENTCCLKTKNVNEWLYKTGSKFFFSTFHGNLLPVKI